MEGFEFPDLLSEISDIDYGLFSVDATDEPAAVLKTEVNLRRVGNRHLI